MQRFKLSKGDKIAIISTARSISHEEISAAVSLLKQWGLEPIVGKTIGKKYLQFAGEDDERASEFQQMLDDVNIKAILFARGGYGTIRILDKIDFTGFVNKPKLLCGYSDITIIHSHITDKLGLPAVHSSMPFNFEKNSTAAVEGLKNILFGSLPEYEINNHALNISGDCEAPLIGGNLSILYSLLGTKYGFNTSGKILFIEDIDEYLYHLDRMMISLKYAGKLQYLKGLIVGNFTDMKDNKVAFGKTAEEIIYSHIKEYHYPVCFNFPAGHITDNRPLILGKKIKLSVNSRVQISYK